LHRLDKKSQHKNKMWSDRTNLFRTSGLDCAFSFYKLSEAVRMLVRYFTLKLDEVNIAFFIGSCSMHSGKQKITVQNTRIPGSLCACFP
jgi:hypothetical protein